MASSFVTLSAPFSCERPLFPCTNKCSAVMKRMPLRVSAWQRHTNLRRLFSKLIGFWSALKSCFKKSAGGVLLPKSAVKFERYLIGEVLAIGTDVGEIETGKKVMFSDINADEVDLGTDGRHCFCKASDLLAVVA